MASLTSSIWGGFSEHYAADFHGADAGVAVEGTDQCLSGELFLGNVGAEGGGIDINRVASCWFNYLDAGGEQAIAEVGGGAYAVVKVIFMENLFKALGHRFQGRGLQVRRMWGNLQ